MKNMKEILDTAKVIAVYGASIKPERSSCRIAKYLMAKGYTVYPINKMYAGQKLAGREILATISDVPEKIDILNVFRKSVFLPEILPETLKVKPKTVWLQLEIRNEDVEKQLKDAGIEVITDHCIYTVHSGKPGEI